jgi:putative FmdB family regulatory protein
MPIYEYECQKCGHTLEALQKFSDKPLRECPECGKHQLKRLVSAPLFRLAGSGWYETDFKSDKERKRNLHEKGEKEPAASSDSAKPAESKSESAVKAEPASKPEPAGKTRTMVTKPAKAPARKAKPAAKKAPARARKR